MLCVNGQLSSSYTGPLWSINESLAPATQRREAKAIRLAQKPGGKLPWGMEDTALRKHLGTEARQLEQTDIRAKLWGAHSSKSLLFLAAFSAARFS